MEHWLNTLSYNILHFNVSFVDADILGDFYFSVRRDSAWELVPMNGRLEGSFTGSQQRENLRRKEKKRIKGSLRNKPGPKIQEFE